MSFAPSLNTRRLHLTVNIGLANAFGAQQREDLNALKGAFTSSNSKEEVREKIVQLVKDKFMAEGRSLTHPRARRNLAEVLRKVLKNEKRVSFCCVYEVQSGMQLHGSISLSWNNPSSSQ